MCAVKELRAWLEVAGIHRGPVFRRMRRGDNLTDERLSDQSVALIVKRRARAAGLPPEDLSGHSLSAGYATAAAAGIEERKIANVTRHKNLSVWCAATSAPPPLGRRRRSAVETQLDALREAGIEIIAAAAGRAARSESPRFHNHYAVALEALKPRCLQELPSSPATYGITVIER